MLEERGFQLSAPRPRCAYCHDDLGEDLWRCSECGALLDRACAAELGACPSLGCERRVLILERPSARPKFEFSELRWPWWRAAQPDPAIGALLLFGFLGPICFFAGLENLIVKGRNGRLDQGDLFMTLLGLGFCLVCTLIGRWFWKKTWG